MGAVSDFFSNVDFQSIINSMQAGGWFQIVFPFLLVYALTFTITQYIKIVEDKKAVRVIISLVFSLFAVAFPIADNQNTLGDLMIALFPGVSAFTMALLALYIIAGMMGVNLMDFLGKEGTTGRNVLQYTLGGLGVIVVAFYYGKGFGVWDRIDGLPYWFTDIFGDPLLYILILFGLFFFWISKDDKVKYVKPPVLPSVWTLTEVKLNPERFSVFSIDTNLVCCSEVI